MVIFILFVTVLYKLDRLGYESPTTQPVIGVQRLVVPPSKHSGSFQGTSNFTNEDIGADNPILYSVIPTTTKALSTTDIEFTGYSESFFIILSFVLYSNCMLDVGVLLSEKLGSPEEVLRVSAQFAFVHVTSNPIDSLFLSALPQFINEDKLLQG